TRQTDEESTRRADDDRRDDPDDLGLVVVLAALCHAAQLVSQVEEGAQYIGAGGEHERDADRELDEGLLFLRRPDLADDPPACGRSRHRPDDEQAGQLEVGGPVPEGGGGPDRLVHGGRDEVVGHGGGRGDAEEDQGGGHQCPATHPGQTDDDADAEGDEQQRGDVAHQMTEPGVSTVRWPLDCSSSSTWSRASSMPMSVVSMVMSASTGTSYGALTPVKSGISPAIALA